LTSYNNTAFYPTDLVEIIDDSFDGPKIGVVLKLSLVTDACWVYTCGRMIWFESNQLKILSKLRNND